MSVFHGQIEELEKKYEEGQSLDNDQVCLSLSNKFWHQLRNVRIRRSQICSIV